MANSVEKILEQLPSAIMHILTMYGIGNSIAPQDKMKIIEQARTAVIEQPNKDSKVQDAARSITLNLTDKVKSSVREDRIEKILDNQMDMHLAKFNLQKHLRKQAKKED